ncbi:MAG: hypothetical protein QG608_2077 [Actinomycetota bacterium]|nr:hypothetical protein [Actinomycetota bacterium]
MCTVNEDGPRAAPRRGTGGTAGDPPWELRLWRDHDPGVHGISGIDLGRLPVRTRPRALVGDLYARGVRRVRLDRPVDLSGAMSPRTLVDGMILLQELTAWGIVVDWTVRWGENQQIWEQLQHVYPPQEFAPVSAAPGSAAPASATTGEAALPAELVHWRKTFYLCKCFYRRGPGFLQVRDRRRGVLSRFVIDDPRYLDAVDRLLDGAPVEDLPQDVLGDFVQEGLAGTAGTLGWWLPYRVRRWPWPAVMV